MWPYILWSECCPMNSAAKKASSEITSYPFCFFSARSKMDSCVLIL